MADHKVQGRKNAKKEVVRLRVGDFFILMGMILLFSVALARVKVALASQEMHNRTYLVSELGIEPPLPDQLSVGLFTPASTAEEPEPLIVSTVEIPAEEPSHPAIGAPVVAPVEDPVKFPVDAAEAAPSAPPEAPVVVMDVPSEGAPAIITNGIYLPSVYNPDPGLVAVSPADDPTTGPVLEGGAPGMVESAGAIVRLMVPSLQIDRTVVPMGLKKSSGKQMVWNTDALFSTNNRSDLVGQMITSANPGEGGNIVLVGHNYNNGWVYPTGVFIGLQNTQVGSPITVVTESGKKFEYIVQIVKKVPWRLQNDAELEKHQKFLWPSAQEQLTLVTCGGANFGVWSARIYVVARPSNLVSSN